MAPPRRTQRIAEELASGCSQQLRPEHINPNVLRRLCRLGDDRMMCGDRDSLRIARLCCRIAGQLGTPDARARGFACLASALRLANRLDHAEQALDVGLTDAPVDRRGDLFRRRAYLRISQQDYSGALIEATVATRCTSGYENTRALAALGIAFGYGGNHSAAVDALGQCLAKTHPDDTIPYCNAIHNYATALAYGSDADAAQAVTLCAALRPKLKYRHKMQRAKLWWTEGLLHERLGDGKAAWRSFDTARRSLVAMEAAPEVAALVADMARVSSQPPTIRMLCDEVAALIAAPHPLTAPLQTLAGAAREMIPEAAAALRAAASRLAPCPAM